MKDIDFEKHVFYKRFLVRFEDFKRTFLSNDVQKDLDCLPDCTKQDSLERWLEIYENAFLHFTGVIQDNDPRFIENYELLVDIYGEGVIYPTKRKIEYIKELLSLNTETTPLLPQPISANESRTKKVICENITNIDKQGWQYAFVSEQDYNLFTDLLTNFFEYNSYTLPETIIKLKRTCKTKVAKALGEIHKELSNENKLSTDTKYFELIRVLSPFEKETKEDLYKALTR